MKYIYINTREIYGNLSLPFQTDAIGTQYGCGMSPSPLFVLIVAKCLKILMQFTGYGVLIICLSTLFSSHIKGQIPLFKRERKRTVRYAPKIKLDTLTVIPQSVVVLDTNGTKMTCRYEMVDNLLVFEDSTCLNRDRFLTISYRVLPFRIGKRFRYIDTTNLTSASEKDNYIYDYKVDPVAEGGIFGTKGVRYSGSFSRGLSIGNNQDLIYDADFNMAMEGDIGDGIHIKGAIADNKLPIQPEGNTKQLSAFDRVFIELSRGPYRLLAGDYDSRSGKSRFLKYNRKLLGLSFHSDTEAKGWRSSSKAEFAISKGKFRRQQLQVHEGNQGPYKLTGNQGERYIVVISGSERVYYDGVPLERGEDADYVMNYNLGEIAFTIRRPITINSRIIVEFEYLNQQYSRTVVTGNTQWAKGKTTIFIEGYSRTDSRTPSVNFQGSFDSTAIALLQQAPESRGDIFISGIRPIEDIPPESSILYVMRDTFYQVGGIRKDTQVLVYDRGKTQEKKFKASFSEVGPGRGDYTILRSEANGRIYRWVAPDESTGAPMGEYTPAIRIVPPSTHQVVDAGVHYKINKRLSASAEAAWSHLDLNRYSSLYEDNDNGLAFDASMKWSHPIGMKWKVKSSLGYRYQGRNFAVVDPYREVEFKRYWNLSELADSTYTDHQPHFMFSLSKDDQHRIGYKLSSLIRPGIYIGKRQDWELKWKAESWVLSTTGGVMRAEDPITTSAYYTPKARLEYLAKTWSSGLIYQGEDNRKRDNQVDTLNKSSFYFHQLEGYVRLGSKGINKKEVRYIRRIDGLAADNAMRRSTVSDQLSLRMAGGAGALAQWTLEGGVRQLDVEEKYIKNNSDQKTLLGKINLQSTFWKEAVQYTGVYELNAGQEPKLEFVFVEVRPGEGQYIYKDYNQDGVPQINEYVLAPYGDTARYVKLRAFNNNFIQTNSTILQQTINFSPKKLKSNEWTNWNLRSVYRSDKKAMSSKSGLRINPLEYIPDSALVRLREGWNTRWVYNPGGRNYDVTVRYNQTAQRVVLVTGYEAVNSGEWLGKLRWNIKRTLDLNITYKRGRRKADSETFEDRKYDLSTNESELKLSYIPQSKLKLSLTASGSSKHNQSLLQEEARQGSLTFEGIYRQSARQALRLSFKYASVTYSGISGTSLELIMLDGLRNGNNYLWECQWDRRLSGNVYLKLNYNGRKTGSSKIVHTGTLQMKALF